MLLNQGSHRIDLRLPPCNVPLVDQVVGSQPKDFILQLPLQRFVRSFTVAK